VSDRHPTGPSKAACSATCLARRPGSRGHTAIPQFTGEQQKQLALPGPQRGPETFSPSPLVVGRRHSAHGAIGQQCQPRLFLRSFPFFFLKLCHYSPAAQGQGKVESAAAINCRKQNRRPEPHPVSIRGAQWLHRLSHGKIGGSFSGGPKMWADPKKSAQAGEGLWNRATPGNHAITLTARSSFTADSWRIGLFHGDFCQVRARDGWCAVGRTGSGRQCFVGAPLNKTFRQVPAAPVSSHSWQAPLIQTQRK